jgi:hypothetical protein
MPTRTTAARRVALLAALVATAVAGCGDVGATRPQASEPSDGGGATAWSEPDDYAYTLLTTCGERAGLGLFRLWVHDGHVERAKPLRRWSDLLPLNEMPSIGDIVRIVADADRRGADQVRVTRAPDGRPRWVSIDYMSNAMDDEACFRVTDVTILSG